MWVSWVNGAHGFDVVDVADQGGEAHKFDSNMVDRGGAVVVDRWVVSMVGHFWLG